MGRRDGQFTVGIMSYGINLRTLGQPHTSIAFCGEKDQARPRRCHEEHREIPFASAKRMPRRRTLTCLRSRKRLQTPLRSNIGIRQHKPADLGHEFFDAAFSRFGVMFFSHPVAAFANIRASLKPDGRLAFVCWRPLNENPWMDASRTSTPATRCAARSHGAWTVCLC